MSELITEMDIHKIVLNELIKKGYPQSSIINEYRLSSGGYADFVIVDAKTSLPLMLIEVKKSGNNNKTDTKRRAFEQLKRYNDKNDISVKFVAAIFYMDEGAVKFVDFTEAIRENNYDRLIDNYVLPSYEVITAGAFQKIISRKKENNAKSISVLKIICWIIIPIICIAAILLDALNIYTFSTLRLIVIGALGAILLLPCYKEIKIGEISLKNELEKQKEESESWPNKPQQ